LKNFGADAGDKEEFMRGVTVQLVFEVNLFEKVSTTSRKSKK
jgi:hypothetical protein